jgi:hypothetical protein
MKVPTSELLPGMKVRIGINTIRTVAHVTDSGWRTRNNEPLLNVYYAEADLVSSFKANGSTPDREWEVIEPCAASADP